ncbi:hypothetical protein GGR88_002614 [Sphingomonas jejuensis]|uniref:Tetratricopeptide repeat protein n=1 Tax=Sphingomonas jejuensis TaxID=904715 RepID=A0ABX0XPE3_9SPHN|nr:hypothetical protein [Sphingomonas jejuensis]NJC35100.1 hypothetical protein [Sphingomonas jejuensis]
MSMIIALLLLQTEATIPQDNQTIIVTARRSQEILAECLARACPPAEEIEAALDAGVDHFRAGNYRQAKAVLARAVTRNRRHAASLPEPVSTLLATYADVARQDGDVRIFRHATRESVTILREHRGENSLTALHAGRRIGDSLVVLGQLRSADDAYTSLQARALAAGYPMIAADIAFQRAQLAINMNRFDQALRLTNEGQALAGVENRSARARADVLRTRVATGRGDTAAVDRLLATLRAAPGTRPILVFAPPFPDLGEGGPETRPQGVDSSTLLSLTGPLNNPLSLNNSVDWVDIGFWIRPDGSAADAAILRGSTRGEWARPLLRQIAQRRYSRTEDQADGSGFYRVERYSLRAPITLDRSGSRIAGRAGPRTLEVVDLSSFEDGS